MGIKNKEQETQYRIEMERMRLQTFYLINIQLKKDDKYETLTKLMPFDWDKKETKPKIDNDAIEWTEDDWEKIDKKYPGGKLKNKKHG